MDNMLLKNLIENLPKKNKNIKIKGLTINSKEVENFIFLQLKEINLMGKNILTKQLIKEQEL